VEIKLVGYISMGAPWIVAHMSQDDVYLEVLSSCLGLGEVTEGPGRGPLEKKRWIKYWECFLSG